MVLELANAIRIDVLTILGGPVNFEGITRDVLTIEVDPKLIPIETLEKIFGDIDSLAHIYTYEEDEDGGNPEKIEIGEGYTIVVGIDEVTRKVTPFPGKIVPVTYETINVVTLAQMTYDEWMESKYSK